MQRLGTKVGVRDFLGNLGIFWELTWDFCKITVGNTAQNLPVRLSWNKQVNNSVVL